MNLSFKFGVEVGFEDGSREGVGYEDKELVDVVGLVFRVSFGFVYWLVFLGFGLGFGILRLFYEVVCLVV